MRMWRVTSGERLVAGVLLTLRRLERLIGQHRYSAAHLDMIPSIRYIL
jgi:hypothetical protein